ncbi:molybdenum cofactor biosysynthesis protein [Oceanicola sp. 22II-s10i]|uniref:MOSC domain-containing protein n=1 Tax=Oceanicola sp. 22II-s10i TaxID=1317116 RepID=UPI000B524F5E|nr:MOSC domain-containing protein [Oceanicola sp. 22II-s10i]OWU83999.1 molybdenum cofactor biosysynthesis protein [Oceanicola sp. 22II-s10i]
MATLARIWRHPVKGVGCETLDGAMLAPDRPLPGDRAYGILTGDTQDTGDWQSCRYFARGCYGPALMAVTAETQADGRITFRHPDRPEITLDPETEGARLVAWTAAMYPDERPAPRELVKAPSIGLSDANYPSISILGLAALDALSLAAGVPMDPRRFRGNLWLDGLSPFEEFDWVGKRIRIGGAELEVTERIDRCRATEADPETGQRNVNTLAVLRDNFGHVDFGVKARVVTGGQIATGDTVAFA